MARQSLASAARSTCKPARPRLCRVSSAARLCPSRTSTVVSLMLLAYAAAKPSARHFRRWECEAIGEGQALLVHPPHHFRWLLLRDTLSERIDGLADRRRHWDNRRNPPCVAAAAPDIGGFPIFPARFPER